MTVSITRQRVVVLLTSVALALTLLFVAITAAGPADADIGGVNIGGVSIGEQPTVTHTVRSGDTLWSIAASVTEPGDDVRNAIEDIKKANNLPSSLITPGQVLVLP